MKAGKSCSTSSESLLCYIDSLYVIFLTILAEANIAYKYLSFVLWIYMYVLSLGSTSVSRKTCTGKCKAFLVPNTKVFFQNSEMY